ncbi:MAG: VanZ family protein [Acidobacteria bacterium]|nr:VanZ family protein [Acidobacteriota bacterium]
MPAEAGTKNEGRRRWLTAYVPLVLWLVVVLGLGTGIGSSDETSRIIRPILKWLLPHSPASTITAIHSVIRKFAHFAEYAFFAALAWNAFKRLPYPFLPAFLLTAAVAFIDEFGQSLNVSRTSSLYDVLIDCTGGLFACLSIWLIIRYRTDRPGH